MRTWCLGLMVCVSACGRTGFSNGFGSGDETGASTTTTTTTSGNGITTAGEITVGSSGTDAPPPATGRSPVDPLPDACPGVTLAYDDFNGTLDGWQLGSLWTFVEDPFDRLGGTLLHGDWMDFDVGCPGSSDVFHLREIDLTTVTSAQIRLTQRGGSCELDTLRVEVTDLDTGERFATREPFLSSEWSVFSTDLSEYIGRPRVMVSLGFDNVCGDPCGVDWYVEEFVVCGE